MIFTDWNVSNSNLVFLPADTTKRTMTCFLVSLRHRCCLDSFHLLPLCKFAVWLQGHTQECACPSWCTSTSHAAYMSFDIRRCVALIFSVSNPFPLPSHSTFPFIIRLRQSSPLRCSWLSCFTATQRQPYATQSAFSDFFRQITPKLIKF